MDHIAQMSDRVQCDLIISKAIESLLCDNNEPALEGLTRTLEKDSKALDKKINDVMKIFKAACDRGDVNSAIQALDAVDKIIDEEVERVKNIPPEKYRWVKGVGAILIAIVGVAAYIKSPLLTSKIASEIGKTLPSVGANKLFRIGIDTLLKIGISQTTWSPALKPLIRGIVAGTKKDFEKMYGEHANSRNATYRMYFKSLIQSKKYVSDLKAALRSNSLTMNAATAESQ